MEQLNPKAKVLVAQGSAQARTWITACVKEIGYDNVLGVNSVADAVSVLEVEDIGWLIVPLSLDGPVNTLQVARLCLTYPEFRHTKISVFFTDETRHALPHVFALGALSCHPADFSKGALGAEFAELKRRATLNELDTCLVSASYLRDLLIRLERWSELLEFTKVLLQHYPGRSRLLLDVAEAQALAGDKIAAAATLAQTRLLEPSLADEVEAMRSRRLPDIALGDVSEAGGANILGITGAVVVDADEVVLNAVRDTLTSLGAKDVEYFTNPEAALKYLKDGRAPSLVLQEWRLPKINGPLFIQRLRQLGHEHAPVIVMSSLVSDKDQHLTREMGVAAVVPKPFNREELIEALVWTIRQERRPTEVRVYERKLLGLLARKSFGAAKELCQLAAREARLPENVLLYFDAEIAYAFGKFERAKALAFDALRKGLVSVRVYHLIGRVMMRLGDFASAVKCLDKAQELSPMNILRLCALADANCELGRVDAGRAALDRADALDPTNAAVATADANFCLTTGDVKRASKILHRLDSFDDVLSYLNNRGVMLARSGRSSEAIGLYQRSLEALPPKAGKIEPLIRYNLALAHARTSDLPAALAEAEKAASSKDARVTAKARSLRDRAKVAITKGTEFQLRLHDAAAADEVRYDVELPPSEATAEVESLLETHPGDRCCYKLYCEAHPDKALSALHRELPPYKRRSVIVREATGGLERDFKSR